MPEEKTMTISEQMADFALCLRYEDIPREHIEYGKMLLLDTFGVAMSCCGLPHAQAVRETVQELNNRTDCTLWGTKEKAGLADAVLYNSCLIHGADYDDTHVAAILHPSAAVVAAAWVSPPRGGFMTSAITVRASSRLLPPRVSRAG